jgi:hypothetical protein
MYVHWKVWQVPRAGHGPLLFRPGPVGSDRRQARQGRVDPILRQLEIGHLAREVPFIGNHVEVPVTAQGGQDDLLPAGLRAFLGLFDHGGDRVRRLGRRDDPLGPRERECRCEALPATATGARSRPRPASSCNYPKTGQAVAKFTGEWPYIRDPYMFRKT